MPELPEVEVVCRQLNAELSPGISIIEMSFHRKDIRYRIPIKKLKELEGAKIESLFRRGKYLLFKTTKGYIVSHLGMSGSWSIFKKATYQKRTHDHVRIELSNDRLFIYNDPRRFGLIDFSETVESCKHLKNLGPEPWSESFSAEYLYQVLRNKDRCIKAALMDAQVVVGVGNIYASEILHKVGIRPTRKSKRLSKIEISRIILEVQNTLSQAIEKGGSTIQSFQNAQQKSGYFQNQFQVYDREGQSCYRCKGKIKKTIIQGRSTFYCSDCQS